MYEQKLYEMSQLKRASHIVPIVPSPSNTTKFCKISFSFLQRNTWMKGESLSSPPKCDKESAM